MWSAFPGLATPACTPANENSIWNPSRAPFIPRSKPEHVIQTAWSKAFSIRITLTMQGIASHATPAAADCNSTTRVHSIMRRTRLMIFPCHAMHACRHSQPRHRQHLGFYPITSRHHTMHRQSPTPSPGTRLRVQPCSTHSEGGSARLVTRKPRSIMLISASKHYKKSN